GRFQTVSGSVRGRFDGQPRGPSTWKTVSGDLDIREKKAHDLVSRADRESEEAILGVIRRSFPQHRILAEESGRSEPLVPGTEEMGEVGIGGDGESRGNELEVGEWIVDPLDGTANYLQGLPVFCISIGYRVGPEVVVGVVLDPVGGNLFSATLGGGARWNGEPMRVSSATGLEGAFLATGYPFRARKALDLYLDLFRRLFFRSRGIRRCGAAALDLAHTAAGVFDGFFEFRLSPWDLAAGVLLIREAGGVVSDLDGGSSFFSGGKILAGPEGLHQELLAEVRDHVSESLLDQVSPTD
ncbi:MAG: inositol monophosphatase, partial [Holophagales bacterium]|nr:inositol monophosphatase [Holophagales bacterium]